MSKLAREKASEVISKSENSPEIEDFSLKEKASYAASQWLEKNRSLVLRQTPAWAQGLALVLIGLGTVAVAGGIFFKIDEVVTVQGQLKSIGGTIEVKTPAGGRVAEVLFRDGEKVKKGQLLLRFDTRQAASDKKTLIRQIELENQQKQARLKIIYSQMNTLEGRVQVLKNRLETQNTIISEMENLVSQGGYQRLQFLERQDQIFGLQKQISEVNEGRSRLELEVEKLKLENQTAIDRYQNELSKVKLQLLYQNVLAPASGIVFDPQAQKEGVIAAGERILSIVPQKGLYAEVFVPNQDIGYIKINQSAQVRVDAFPFSRYGEIPASITQIGADALPPSSTTPFYRFPVKLKLSKDTLSSQGASIPLKSGMSITTNLKLRDKRVISIVSDIFVDQTDSIRSLRQQ